MIPAAITSSPKFFGSLIRVMCHPLIRGSKGQVESHGQTAHPDPGFLIRVIRVIRGQKGQAEIRGIRVIRG
jgi:hypothetical protein